MFQLAVFHCNYMVQWRDYSSSISLCEVLVSWLPRNLPCGHYGPVLWKRDDKLSWQELIDLLNFYQTL